MATRPTSVAQKIEDTFVLPSPCKEVDSRGREPMCQEPTKKPRARQNQPTR